MSGLEDMAGAEFKPCPFCGGEAKRITIGDEEPNNVGGDVIVCNRCQASSHVEFGYKENLVSHWNTRARTPSPSLTRLIEAGKDMRFCLDGELGSFDCALDWDEALTAVEQEYGL